VTKAQRAMRCARKRSLIGKWRITEMELWDKAYLDMSGPPYSQFKANGDGEFKFGCVACGIDCDFSDDDAEFTFQGHDEMDEVSGSGWAELNDDGTLSGEISFHLGDESSFKFENGEY
jgi:hypothetical protein